LNAQGDRNHFRLPVEHAHDSGVAILHNVPTGSVVFTILKALRGEGSVAKTSALFMGRSTEPNWQQRMSAGQQALWIDVGQQCMWPQYPYRRAPELR